MAFVASTLWPKPLLNQNSREMGITYAGIIFFSLVSYCPTFLYCCSRVIHDISAAQGLTWHQDHRYMHWVPGDRYLVNITSHMHWVPACELCIEDTA